MEKASSFRKWLGTMARQPLNEVARERASSIRTDLRRHLQKERGKAFGEDNGAALKPIVFRRDVPRFSSPPRFACESEPRVKLEEAVGAAGSPAPDGSGVYIIRRPLIGTPGKWDAISEAFGRAIRERSSGARAQLARIGIKEDLLPEDVIFLDVETTGLSSSPLFLIGAMAWEGVGLVVRQFLARDYSQERPALIHFLQLATCRKVIISFNGKAFDYPYLRMRAVANGVRWELERPHLDLLPAARRLWRGEVPDCRLQTLERFICRRVRTGDIPTHLIPEAYHTYVRTGNAAQMLLVLKHNFLDLVTMAELVARMPAP